MKYILTSLLLLVSWTPLAADQLPQRIAQWQPNVCRVRADEGGGISYGSGVYVGRGLVVTAFHVVREWKTSRATRGLSVTFHNGGTYQATISGWASGTDIAFLKIDAPKEANIKGVLLASADPARGSVVWKCGYGGDGQLIWHKGTVQGYSSNGLIGGACWFRVTPYARSGDSGGPTFNDQGEFLGDLWGSDPQSGTTTAVLPSAIKLAMGDTVWNNLRTAHVQCYGGQCYPQQRGGGPFFWLRPRQDSPGLRPQQPGPNLRDPAPGGIPGGQNPQIGGLPQTIPGDGRPAAPTAPLVPVQPPVDLKPLQDQIAALQAQIKALNEKPAPVAPVVDLSGLQAQLDALKNRPQGDPEVTAALAELNRKMIEYGNQIGPREPIVTNPQTGNDSSTNNQTQVGAAPEEDAGFDWGSALGMAIMLGAGATGVGIPAWGVMAWRGARAAKRLRDARLANQPAAQPAQPPPRPAPQEDPLYMPQPDPPVQHTQTTHVVDAPAPPVSHRIDTQFVNVESDNYKRAHEMARQQIARRYPGSQDILEAELSLTRQFAAGAV